MKLIIEKNETLMSKKAAQMIAEKITQKPDCVLGLATGSTPLGTYKALVKKYKKGQLDFSQVVTFNLDEYLGIGMDLARPYSQDQSYARFMYEELLKHINIDHNHVHVLDGLTKDPHQFCLDYEQSIKKNNGIDLQILGIGGNGHIAFNEPGSSLASRTRLIGLTQKTLEDNYEKFYKKAGIKKEHMPRHALSMGIGTILEAKHALMLVSGKGKAGIIQHAIEGCLTARVPASAIQLHPGQVTVILDEDAASKLTWSLNLVESDG